ncbi:MAG: hypothetical protein LBU23_00525 [Planctomycetota bacterium]|nr:hypothetical protein [Planctomycetota bacterium]
MDKTHDKAVSGPVAASGRKPKAKIPGKRRRPPWWRDGEQQLFGLAMPDWKGVDVAAIRKAIAAARAKAAAGTEAKTFPLEGF